MQSLSCMVKLDSARACRRILKHRNLVFNVEEGSYDSVLILSRFADHYEFTKFPHPKMKFSINLLSTYSA